MKLWPFRRKSLIPGEPRSGITTIQVPQGSLRLHDQSLSYEDCYRSSAAVRAVVDFLASNVAQIPCKAYVRSGDDRQPLGRKDPLVRLLREPNRRTTGQRLIRDVVADVAVAGNAYLLKIRGDDGRVGGLVRVPPARVSLVSEDATETLRYRVEFGSGSREWDVDDLVHFRTHSPSDSRIGVSPLESLRSVIAEDQAASRHRAAYFRNAARREGIIERPLDAPAWKDDAHKRFREDWQAAHTGEGAGKTAILEEGMTFKESSWSPKDSEFLAGRKLTLDLVSAVYAIPIQSLGGSDRNLREGRRMFLTDVAPTWCALIEEELNLSLVSDVEADTQAADGRIFVEFQLLEKLRGDAFVEAEYLKAATGGPWMTPNETRRALNLPPVEGGDRLYVPTSTP